MIIGVPTEVKNNENRVGLTPHSVKKIVDSGEEVYKSSEMVVKVKEPIPDEYKFLNSDLTLFTYLHLAGDPENAKK